MRTTKFDFDPDATDDNGIFTVKAVAGSGALTLDGALVTGTVATMDYARRLDQITAGNDAGITFTYVGTDADGNALTEVLAGGAATPSTETTTGYFKTVTSITASGAAAGNVTIGTTDEFTSATIPIDSRSDTPCTIALYFTGTIDITVQEGFDSIKRDDLQSINWFDIDGASEDGGLTDLTAITANAIGASHVGATAVKFVVNSFTDTAEVQMYLSQPLNG